MCIHSLPNSRGDWGDWGLYRTNKFTGFMGFLENGHEIMNHPNSLLSFPNVEGANNVSGEWIWEVYHPRFALWLLFKFWFKCVLLALVHEMNHGILELNALKIPNSVWSGCLYHSLTLTSIFPNFPSLEETYVSSVFQLRYSPMSKWGTRIICRLQCLLCRQAIWVWWWHIIPSSGNKNTRR